MSKRSMFDVRTGVLFCLFVVGMIAVLAIIPFQFGSKAQIKTGSGLFTRTESHDPSLPNYDIRDSAKEEAVMDFFASARGRANKDATVVADIREGFVRGESSLKSRIPQVKVEYNADIRTPEVITPDVWKNRIEWLSSPSTGKRSEILRNFVKENNELIGINDRQADSLKVLADYTNPDGNISYAHLEQMINGVPVFRGEVKAGFTTDGRIIRVINNLAPGLDYESLSTDFRDPSEAVRSAFKHVGREMKDDDVTPNSAKSNDLVVRMGNGGDWATTAEKMYFPTEPGVAFPAWRVLVWEPVSAYYVIVDAETGRMLWRKNITEDQTQSATYQVYNNPNSYMLAADSPAPFSPGPTGPINTQAPLATRTNVALIGNEAPNTFNNNGWITDGANITDGNATEAGVDRVAPNGVDAPQTGSPNRVFDSTWNPAPGSPAPGDDPLTAQAQRGAVIQMFYLMNRYHDVLYQRGFTEQAFNFQASNFGRGGAEADRVSSEGQDSSGTNNANFATPADGGRGRMQMFLWTGPTPDYDGTADAEVVIHEVTHGLSNRLHGNAAGLSTNMSRGMGEGWGDWYAYTMLAEPADAINGVYTTGGYATFMLGGFTSNYYHGIRRFPRAPITFTGGPNNLPHNPFTFKHLNSNCDTTLGTTAAAVSSAFPRNPVISTSSGVQACDQVHNAGEIWSSALWEVRNRMVTRLGFTPGTTRVLQVVTDGMKLAPVGPTFLQERDAIIAAAAALPVAPEAAADVFDVREGFRVRGMGFSASIQNAGTGANNAAVTEAFDVPNAVITNPITVSDSTGDNDGFPEPGENLLVSVPITNNSGGGSISNVNAQVTGGGGAVSYGSIADGATVTRNLTYTVPGGAACGSVHQITITGTSDLGALNPQNFSFTLGAPVGGPPVTFNGGAIANPGTGTVGVAAPYPSTINVSGLSGNKKIILEFTNLNTTFPGDMDWLLVGPGGQKYIVMSDVVSAFSTQTNATVVLKDGAAAALPTGALANMAGEWRPTNHGANDAFAAPAPAAPYENAEPGGAATFASVFGTSGAAMNGTWSLYGVDDVSGDIATITGWKLTFEANDFVCTTNVRSRADFDGDGRTDLSVYRPSEGNWYLQRSTAGFGVLNWGLSGDTLVPGDYDGDAKADTAVFRPDANPASADYFVLNSNGFTVSGFSWGSPGDLPVSGDYDGDGKTDQAIYRPSEGTWYIRNSGNSSASVIPFGLNGDIPLAFDLENDGKTNLAVFRPSENRWYIARNTGVPAQNFEALVFGQAGDKLVPADYDGDNKDDIAVFRPSTGQWIIRRSSTGATRFTFFGNSTDVPVPGDYDGDGSDDLAIYRNGVWWLNRSTSGLAVLNFGLASDTAIPAKYIP
ncbi:MAG: M36 family metallopeptidase [Pyrinomonadaceae bacterium]